MRKTLLSLALIFGITSPVIFADEPKKDDSQLAITKPEKVTTNHLNIFKIKTVGKSLSVKVLNNKENVETYLSPNLDAVVVLFKEPGEYSFYVVTAHADVLIEAEFTAEVIGDGGGIDPVKPDQMLIDAFQKAYSADSNEYKRKSLDALIEAMKFAVVEAKGKTEYANNSVFVIKVSDKTKELVGSNLIGLRTEIGKYLNSTLPSDKVSIFDEVNRKKHAYEYKKIVDALSAVK